MFGHSWIISETWKEERNKKGLERQVTSFQLIVSCSCHALKSLLQHLHDALVFWFLSDLNNSVELANYLRLDKYC